jgi:DNA-binding CsgD family transcriptional regulator
MIVDFLSRIFSRYYRVDQRRSSSKILRSLASLTPREKQIAFLWIHSNKQISRQLYITPETVRCHWKNIYAKLGVHSKIEVGQLVEKEKSHGEANTSQS